MKLKRSILILFFLGALFLITACNNDNGTSEDNGSNNNTNNNSNESEDVQSGGTLNVAFNAQPPSLDPHVATATATRDTARLVFEALLVLNSNFESVPFLAEEVKNEDNQKFTFHLREGIMFHNGQEMKAEDVVASMNRWKALQNDAVSIIGDNDFVEEDEYTVSLELEEPSAALLDVMATPGQFAAIMPKDIAESAGPDGVTEYIGTGPFEFEEWQQDNYIHFTKYDDYQPLEEETDGLAGKREALVDDIYFYITTDSSTRLAGIQSGEYDFAYQLPFDSYEQLMATDLNVEANYTGDMVLQFNSAEGLFADPIMRQAVNAALDIDEILAGSLVASEIYSAGPNLMQEENVQWATDAGAEYFNQNDTELAQELLDEAGYDGEEVIIYTTRDYQHYYDSSVVIQEQLENLGMNVSLEVYDWPTLSELVSNTSDWHMRVNGYVFRPEPTRMLYLDPSFEYVGRDDHAEDLKAAIQNAETSEEARADWEELQEYIWSDYLPVIKLGTYSSIFALANYVDGYANSNGAHFWNISVNN